MKSLISIALAAGLLVAPASAIHLHKRTDGAARVVGFPIQRRDISDPVSRDRLRRRSETVQVSLDNEVSWNTSSGCASAYVLTLISRLLSTLPTERSEPRRKTSACIWTLAAVICG